MNFFDKLFGGPSEGSEPGSGHDPWRLLETDEDLDRLVARSREVPCLIFKHSTRCSLSQVARHRLFRDWRLDLAVVEPWFLDLIAHRRLSDRVAEQFGVRHESPQVILVKDGKAVFHTSHGAISVDAVKGAL